MGNINKYLKIAKDAEIEPEDRIEDKIMDRISHLKEEDKEEILDDDFLEFLKNTTITIFLWAQVHYIRNLYFPAFSSAFPEIFPHKRAPPAREPGK